MVAVPALRLGVLLQNHPRVFLFCTREVAMFGYCVCAVVPLFVWWSIRCVPSEWKCSASVDSLHLVGCILYRPTLPGLHNHARVFL